MRIVVRIPHFPRLPGKRPACPLCREIHDLRDDRMLALCGLALVVVLRWFGILHDQAGVLGLQIFGVLLAHKTLAIGLAIRMHRIADRVVKDVVAGTVMIPATDLPDEVVQVMKNSPAMDRMLQDAKRAAKREAS